MRITYMADLLTTEEMVALWSEVLELDELNPDDDFFEIGGDSFAAVNLGALVEERTGVKVPLVTFLADPTPRGMVAALVAQPAGGPSAAGA